MAWTRDDDALIARGIGLIMVGQFLPDYPTSLFAGLRALEEWRKQNRWRAYEIASPYGALEGFAVSMFAETGNHEPICSGNAATLAEAIALALRAACGGECRG